MDRTIIQVPLPIPLEINSRKAALEQGFSSLQEFIRVMLSQIVKKGTTITIDAIDEPITLSSKAKKRYSQMEKDFKNNKNVFVTKSTDDLIKQLHEK